VRFQPDTWLEALLRPIAMAAPDAYAYVEIMAPDFRFVFALVLLALLATLTVVARCRRVETLAQPRGTAPRPVFLLLCALTVAFVSWLATTGNGRYFITGLLIVGPVCVGLIQLLPVTRALRLTLAVGAVALQGFAVQQSAPWQAWTMLPWKEAPYFKVDLPAELRAEPATYVTMSAISYSLLAPLFHPESRWISLHNAPPPGSGAADAWRTEAFLAKAAPDRLMLLVPVVPGMLTPERLPNATVSAAIDGQLARYRLGLIRPQSCRFLASPSLADIGLGAKSEEERANSGFWLCHLRRLEAAAPSDVAPGRNYDAVFKALEAQCPRYFPGGDGRSLALPNGEMRSYMMGEMKAYVYDDGEVYYKYYRALNPVLIGKVDDVVAGKSRVDCGNIRGRSGLPWDREI
jgi:hypothetical protein